MTETRPTRGVVLIADDEEIVRDGLSRLLRSHGFDCRTAANATESLALLRAGTFDALVSDINMPGNAGLEMITAVRAISPALPVILLTGSPTVETAARSVRLPVTAYLTKPPEIDELIKLLDAAIADFGSFRTLEAGRARLQAWEKEIENIERMLRSSAQQPGGVMGNYLRVTLQQVILMLSDLERATGALERPGAQAAALKYMDHEAALRHTVSVLERTRQNFKSKELGELRRQIEMLLNGQLPPAAAHEAAPGK